MHQLQKTSSQLLKEIVITPIYNKGTKEDAKNYHPITLVQALFKVLGKVKANQLIPLF
jgi:small basic protein